MKDAPVFKRMKEGRFSNVFVKNDLKEVTETTKTQDVLDAMKRIMAQAKEILKSGDFMIDYGGRREDECDRL